MPPRLPTVPPAPTNQTQSSPSQTGFNYITKLFTNHIVSPKNQCSNDENESNFENSHLCTPCTPLTLNDRFAAEFGRDNSASVLKQLELERPKLHRNELQKEYDSVPCSTLTRFLWTQAENQNSGNGIES